MLTQEDADIVARDTAIPGLRVLLDEDLLSEVISLGVSDWELDQPRVDYLRYKPKTYCLARLQCSTGRDGDIAYLVAHSAATRSKFYKEIVPSSPEQPACRARLAQDIAIYRFPFDRCISGLANSSSPTATTELLRRAAPSLSFGEDVTASVLRYKPERRCAIRLNSAGRSTAAMKLYTPWGYKLARRAAKTIGGMSGDLGPRCIGHSDRHATLLFEWCRGKELTQYVDDLPAAREALSETAVVLSRLHQQRSIKLPTTAFTDFERRARQHLSNLDYISKDLGSEARTVWREIESQLSSCRPLQNVPIHGDLHLDQIMVDERYVRLLDFDRARLGDPAEDLAAIYASMLQKLVTTGREPIDIHSLCDELFTAYARVGSPINRMKIQVFTAIRLLDLLAEPFRYRRPEWISESRRLLESARRLLEEFLAISQHRVPQLESGAAGSVVQLKDSFSLSVDDVLVADSAMLCPRQTTERFRCLSSFDNRHAGIELKSIRVVRHKPGRRCLIEYAGVSRTLHHNVVLLGKVDSKGRYARHFERQLALWQSGFSPKSGNDIRVASPWAIVPEWNMWLQQRVEGCNPWTELQIPAGRSLGIRIARALAKIHCCNVPTHRTHSLHDELTVLTDRLQSAAVTLPELSARISRLQALCEQVSENHLHGFTCPIHRDFYPDQILVTDEHITILDFDLLCMGNPAVDVGNFLAHLIECSLREWRHPYAYLPAAAAFQGEYMRQCPNVTREDIELYSLLSLARHISLCATLPGRRHNAIRVLEYCEEMMQMRGRRGWFSASIYPRKFADFRSLGDS